MILFKFTRPPMNCFFTLSHMLLWVRYQLNHFAVLERIIQLEFLVSKILTLEL